MSTPTVALWIILAQHFPPTLSSSFAPVKIIQWQWRHRHLNKNISPSEEQWDEPKTKSLEEWRAPRRIVSHRRGAEARRRVDDLRCFLSETVSFVFSGRKDTGEVVVVKKKFAGADSFPGWRPSQSSCCQNTHTHLCRFSTLLTVMHSGLEAS